MTVGADLGAAADRGPGIDHGRRPDIGADVDETRHQHDVLADESRAPHHGTRHGPEAGFREAARKAKPVLLEPIMKVEVVTPDQYMGDVTGDLNRRRGMLEGMDSRNNAQVIKAKVPLSEMFGYVTQLRSLSSGRATSTMEFSHYSPAPNNIAEEVIAKVKGKVNA